MYRAFRGADPNKLAMLVARGLVDEQSVAQIEPQPMQGVISVNTREMARQRAERSRRERAEAKLRADSIAQADSLAAAENEQMENHSSVTEAGELREIEKRN